MAEPQIEEPVDEVVVDTPVEMSVEDQAKQLGWHAPDDFKGDPEHALSAEDFIDKMKDSDALMRSNFKKLQNTVTKTAAELEQVKKDQDSYIEMTVKAREAEFKKEMRDAVVSGDTEAFDKAEKGMAEIQKPAPAPVIPVEVQSFKERNADWYGVDKDKTEYANFLDQTVRGDNPQEHYAEIEKLVNKQFKPTPPHVEGSGRKKTPNKASKTFEGMPTEYQQQCDRMVQTSGGKVTKATFVKNYWKGQDNA